MQVNSSKTFFEWMNKDFLRSYYPVNNYNGERLHWTLRQFTEDCQAFRVGPPLLRQVRGTLGG